jgi:TolA-binding protein
MQRSLASVLLAITLASVAAGQTPPTSTQNGERQSADAISKRLDDLQQGLDAQNQSIMTLQQQIRERDTEIQELRQQLSHTRTSTLDAQDTSAPASTSSPAALVRQEQTTSTYPPPRFRTATPVRRNTLQCRCVIRASLQSFLCRNYA